MRSFASKIDPTLLGAAAIGAHVETPRLTFAELVDAYCLQAKPNEPRDYRLKKWKSWFGHRVAWSLTEDELFGALEALSAAGMAPSTRQKHVQTKANWIAWATQKSLSS